MTAQGNKQQPLRWARFGILGVVLLVCFGAIAILGFEVNRKIKEQATASSDNVQWVLSQLEVEYLNFHAAITEAQLDGDVGDVRRRFDILYSRVATFRTGQAYETLRGELSFANLLAGLNAAVNDMIPLIDGPDDDLRAQLPELSKQVEIVGTPVRQIALIGIDYFAGVSDRSRSEVWLTLMRVAALTMALVMALVILAIVLFQLYRVAQRNAEVTRTTSARLEAMVSSTLDAVIVIDEAGLIVEYNGAAEYIFGYSRTEAIGSPMVDMIIPLKYRKAHLEGMKRHLRNGSTHVVGRGRIQMEALRKNGELFPCEFSIARAPASNRILFVSFLRDNSAQVAAEQELLKARDEALAGERTKAEFMAVMSHEMRTPLNGMLGTMELLAETELSPRQRDYLRIIETSGRLLLHHVNDVLDIARLDAGRTGSEKRPFNLSVLVSEVADGQRSLAHANHTELEIDLEALGNPTVLGDQQRLRQVLLNLVSNAIKFTRDGVVRIEAEKLGDSDVVEFRIIDSGIGINEEDLDRIFDDFVTLDTTYAREYGGTGLGLGIAKRLIESLDGAIGAESEPGDGSLFWFRLPLPILSKGAAETVEVEAKPAPRPKPEQSLDILVVEDNQINQLVLEEMLRKEGHSVTLTNDGQEGVAAANLRHYDVILMDISMPRMDGVAATLAIRNGDGRCRDTRIVALTANALPEDIERFKDSGMNDVLVKPISRAKLAKALSIKSPEIIAAAAPRALPALLDTEAVRGLLSDLGAERSSKLLNAFLAETDSLVDQFTTSPDNDDNILIGDIHKLAGSASLFGTLQFSDLLRELEVLGKSGRADEMRTKLSDLPQCWSMTRNALEEIASENVSQ